MSNASTLEKGQVIRFGSYRQKYFSDDKSPIDWIVLDVKDGMALLISQHALDCKPFHEDYGDFTWRDSTIRTWLNNEFLSEAFSEEEQSDILTTTVETADGSNSSIIKTADNVFLLSEEEASRYFASNEERICGLSHYALKQNAAYSEEGYHVGENVAGLWWLRSHGKDAIEAGIVSFDGSLGGAMHAYLQIVCARPAMWVDLKPDSWIL